MHRTHMGDPDDLPAGTLEYISEVIDNLASGRHFSEHGWDRNPVTGTP
jgi:hypothetical protein